MYVYICMYNISSQLHTCVSSFIEPIQGLQKFYFLIPTFLLSSGAFPFFSQLHSLLFNSFSFAATCVSRQESYGVTRGNGQKYMGNWSCNLYKYSFIAITLLLTGRCPPCINILLNKLTELNWAISTLVLRSNHVWFGTHKPRLKRKRLSLATKSTTRQLE